MYLKSHVMRSDRTKKENAFTKPVFIRVNDAMDAIGREDIDAISPYQDQIEAIILPKTQSFDFLATLAPMIDFSNRSLFRRLTVF